MLTHRPQSYAMAKRTGTGDKQIKKRDSGFLKYFTNNKLLFLRLEFLINVNSGKKPISMIKKYLRNTSNEYFPKLPSNCCKIVDFDPSKAQDI